MSTSKNHFALTMIAVFFANFAAVLSATTIIIPLPYLMQAFETNLATISWSVTAFTLATGIIAPTTGYLSNRFGIRSLFISAMSCFLVTSFFCALAWNVYSLIIFRFFQGIFCGIIIPVTMTIIYQLVDRSNQAFALSMWSMSGVLAPATGPTIAGIIIQAFSWQWIFLMNVPIVLLAIVFSLRYMPKEPQTEHVLHRFDWLGLILSMTGTTCLLLAISFSQEWGFISAKTLAVIGISTLLLFAFIRFEFKTPTPLLDLAVFHSKSFAISGYANVFLTFILNCSIYILPLYLQTVRGYSPVETGIIVLAGPIAVAIVSPIVGKTYRRPISRLLTVSGVALMLVGFVLLSRIDLVASIPYLIIAIVILESGMGIAKIPATNYGMEALPVSLTSHGSAVISWLKQCSSSFAVGLITSLILVRTKHHLGAIDPAENPTAYTSAYEQGSIDIFYLAIIGCVIFLTSLLLLMRPKTDDIETIESQ